ncbi:unnamed protein product [Spirodela intermedia]|uniref:Transposase MuDR plant domain-containing protein n=1 Tax=Spirodela intermedia TaxID=51605 RepID=A0A7I8IZD4_SPIIN|nr:unnamed protein product [Spirodela intermedia]CAA6662943.1 unnamed protein product [Spirodela intermedia]
MSELCNIDQDAIDIKFRLPDYGMYDSTLVSVESDDDMRNMMEEFDISHKIPIFLFTDKTQNKELDQEDVESGAASIGFSVSEVPTLETELISTANEDIRDSVIPLPGQSRLASWCGPTTSATSSRGIMMFLRDSESLSVGQEYEDVQTFRNALTSVAIAANFELHMIRSDQRRVTARCAGEGCRWRVHASKLPQVNTFRVRTLMPDHTCVRSENVGHRQATAKWIANCIRDRLRENRNYKPREILNDIHREYGVVVTYKRAFLGREKALEELKSELVGDASEAEDSHGEVQAWGEVDDPPRLKQVCRPFKEVRPLHCTRCNQMGHNRRTCATPDVLGGVGLSGHLNCRPSSASI